MSGLTAEQKKLAAEYESQQKANEQAREAHMAKVDKMREEAGAVAKFLLGTELKMKRT